MGITVGSILYELRKKAKRTQRQLCENLCAPSVYSLYENNDSEPDVLLLTYLFERLGRCQEGITAYITKEEAKYLSWRRNCVHLIQKEDYKELERISQVNLKLPQNINPSICRQYELYIKAVIQEEVYHNKVSAKDLYEQAIGCTCSSILDEELNECCVGKSELELYAIYLNLAMQTGDLPSEKVVSKWYNILEYTKKHFADDKEKMEVYALVACMIAKTDAPRNTWKRKNRILLEAAGLLKRGNGLFHAIEVFRILSHSLEEAEERSIYQELYDALSWMYEEFDYPTEFNYHVLFINHFMYAMVNEYLLEGRITSGFTQEEASANICATESYSRIENGKRKPQPDNYKQLAEKFGIEKRYYTEMIDTNNISVWNVRKKIANAIYLKDDANFYRYIKQIQLLLPHTKQNKQYIESQQLIYLHHKEKISDKEYLEKLIEILGKTLEIESVGNHMHVYTKLEINLINWIAAAYGYLKDYQNSCDLLEKYLSDIYTGDLSAMLRQIEIMMAEFNLGIAYSEVGNEREGNARYITGIKLLIDCYDADMLDRYVSELVCNWENLRIKSDIGKCWKSVLAIAQFYGNEKNYTMIKNYIESRKNSP